MRGDLEQNAETIHESNPEKLLVLRLHPGTIHESNPEHLLVFKAPRGTIDESNPEHLLVFTMAFACKAKPWS